MSAISPFPNSPSIAPPPETKRQKYEVEEEKIEEQKEPQPPFNATALYEFIDIQLQIIPSEMIILEICLTNPELIHQLANCTQTEFKEWMNRAMPQGIDKSRIMKTALTLYTTALLNSGWKERTENLEKSIQKFIPLSDKKELRKLIEKATAVKQRVDHPQKRTEIQEVLSEIDDSLQVFCYKEPDYSNRIENLSKYAKNWEGLLFPNCNKFYPLLLQNLQIAEHEQNELQSLRRDLFGSLLQLNHTKQAPAEIDPHSRKLFLEYQAKLVWEAGESLLNQALHKELRHKKDHPKGQIPSELAQLIKKTHPDLSSLIRQPPEQFTTDFLMSTATTYFGPDFADIADIMQPIIQDLPKEKFSQLQQKPEKELFLQILNDHLQNPTLTSLKNKIGKSK